MTPHKQQPSLLPLAIGGFVILSAIFSGVIALTSSASFLTVFMWCTAFWVVIMIPTLFWGYVIEPRWWDKLSHEKQEKVRNWGGGLLVVAIFLVWFGISGGSSWGGQGQVNLFPEGATSKNYRLDADIEVKTRFLWRKTYTINSVDWPDSGTSYFNGCTIGGSNYTCTDDEGRTWRIEVVQPPDAPDDSNN
jgi:hypothetical protein